jgi:hypothetical protein
MSKRTSYLPSNVLKFQTLVHSIQAHAITNQTRWDISASAIAALETPIKNFDDAVTVSENPETRTAASIRKRNEMREAVEEEVRPFVQGRLYNNKYVTEDDLLAIGLPVRDRKPTQHADIDETPVITFSSNAPATLNIAFRRKNVEGRGKGKDMHGVEVRLLISETPPKDWTELTQSEFATRSPMRLVFNGGDRGKHLYLAARWENNRGGKGPWTEILDTFIP